jgi:hypothetical protein
MCVEVWSFFSDGLQIAAQCLITSRKDFTVVHRYKQATVIQGGGISRFHVVKITHIQKENKF